MSDRFNTIEAAREVYDFLAEKFGDDAAFEVGYVMGEMAKMFAAEHIRNCDEPDCDLEDTMKQLTDMVNAKPGKLNVEKGEA